MSAPAATLRYRRLRPSVPVGLLSRACFELHPRRVACARCAEACPAKVLSLTNESLQISDGCLGCGRCMAACPTGALAVHGFSLTLTPQPTLEALALDCWKVPGHLSPPGAVRVPCLGGLSVSHLLALRYVAGSRQITLLDRAWCGQCAAGRHDCHPAQTALSATRDWLKDIGAPESHWPTFDNQPLDVSFQRQIISNDAAASAVKRRDFQSRRAREVTTIVSEVAAFRIEETTVRSLAQPVHSLLPLRAIEREHQLVLLEQLAARYGGSLPARFFPVVEIGPDCRDHRQCVNLCPTGALGSYQDNNGGGVKFDATACIACGQCQGICPERAVRLQPQTACGLPRDRSVTLTRHALRMCAECDETFSADGRESRCPTCRKSKDFARAGFDTLFRDTTHRKGGHKH